MSANVKFELQLNPVGPLATLARLWVDRNNDGVLQKRDEEVTLVTRDGKGWFGEIGLDGDNPKGILFDLRFLSVPGTNWSLKVTCGDKTLVEFKDQTASERTTWVGGAL